MGTAERSFLAPKQSSDQESTVPSLDEFDAEIDIYRVSLSPVLTVLFLFMCHYVPYELIPDRAQDISGNALLQCKSELMFLMS